MKKSFLHILFFISSSMILLSCQHTNSPKNMVSISEDSVVTHNELSEAEIKDGWELLFDGKSTKNWRTYGTDTIGTAWKVQNGTLYLDASKKNEWQTVGGGDIITAQEYENFHLKLEWKISENGNSGIMFHVHEQPERYEYPWQTGPEMQILDNNGHPDAEIATHRAGDLYDLVESSENVVNPPGEWNQIAIIVENDHLDFYLNGTNIVSVSLYGKEWDYLISKSKFAEMEGFGSFKKGHIALQDHGDKVWFRNIKIKQIRP